MLRTHMSDFNFLPHTLREMQRQEFEYHVLRQGLKRPFVSPISSRVHRILNVGCGTGLWVREVAQLFPHASVIGYDHFLEIPSLLTAGCNYRFQRGSLLDGLPFDDGFFDFTCQRVFSLALHIHALPMMLSELLRVTRPGGWIEVLDVQAHFTSMGQDLHDFHHLGVELLHQEGIAATLPFPLSELLHQLGLHPVHVLSIEQPLGPWLAGREREGMLLLHNFMAAAPYFKDLYTQTGVMDAATFDRHLSMVPHNILVHHPRHCWSLVSGQRTRTTALVG